MNMLSRGRYVQICKYIQAVLFKLTQLTSTAILFGLHLYFYSNFNFIFFYNSKNKNVNKRLKYSDSCTQEASQSYELGLVYFPKSKLKYNLIDRCICDIAEFFIDLY